MTFQKINRNIYWVITHGVKSEWFCINKQNQFQFIKGVFKKSTVNEIYELYKDDEREEEFFEYLQYIHDEGNWKDKANVYEIYKSIKMKERVWSR